MEGNLMKNHKRNDRGQMRVIETILASFVIIFAISFLSTFAIPPPSENYEVTELERLGYNILYELDSQGILEELVYSESWGNLSAVLRVLLPTNVYFNLQVYDRDGNLLNQGYPIAYGDWTIIAENGYTATVTYVLPGNSSYYAPRILKLELVRG